MWRAVLKQKKEQPPNLGGPIYTGKMIFSLLILLSAQVYSFQGKFPSWLFVGLLNGIQKYET